MGDAAAMALSANLRREHLQRNGCAPILLDRLIWRAQQAWAAPSGRHLIGHEIDQKIKVGRPAQSEDPEGYFISPVRNRLRQRRLQSLFWLVDHRYAARPGAGDLDHYLAILCPSKVRCSCRFGEKRAYGQGFELTLIPLLAVCKIQRPQTRRRPSGPRLDASGA